MAKYRRAAKVDSNQNEIVSQLRSIPGISVEVGHDDIFVGHKGKNFWYEIKTPEQVSTKTGDIRQSSLKPSQKRLLESHAGHYKVVWNIGQILAELGIAA